MLSPIRHAAPSRHRPRPTKTIRPTFSPMKAPDSSATQTGARQDMSVALAMVVFMMARCQKVRSPAKNSPASNVARSKAKAPSAGRSQASQNHRTGRARPARQKADAKGPTSARRTKIGDTPMAMAPATSATKAMDGPIAGGVAGMAAGRMGAP